MRRTDEDLFATWRRSRDPRLLGEVFDRCGDELLRVATYLCAGDRTAVEDALQATFLTAIDDAPTFDANRPLRPWLLGILTNHVRKERRRRQRASGAVAERAGAADPTLDQAAARELQAALARSLEQVASPYREVLVLHLEHDLDSTAIGRALDRQPSTVRTQIARGLALLRDLLPAGLTAGVVLALAPEVLANVRSTVLQHAAASSAPLATTLHPAVAGGRRLLTMLTFATLAATAALFLSLPAGESTPTNPEAPAGALATTIEHRDPPRAPAREVAAPPSQTAPAVPTEDEIEIEVAEQLSQQPVAGAQVALGARAKWLNTRASAIAYARTDASGRARFKVQLGEAYGASVVGTATVVDFTAASVPALQARLLLPAGARVVVRTVDASGQPIAGATVMTNAGTHALRDWQPLGTTDAAGQLVATHLAPRAQFVGWASGRAPSPLTSADLHAEGDNAVTLTLRQPGTTLHGRIVDTNGAAVADALVAVVPLGAWPSVPAHVRSDASGRFAADWLPAGHVAIVAMQHAGAEMRTALARLDVELARPTDVELRLTAGATVTGQVAMRADGWPTVSARYLADAITELPYVDAFAMANDGSFRIANLLPGRWRLSAAQGDTEVHEVVTLREGDEFTWNPVIPAALPLRLTLRDQRNQPLAGWRACALDRFGLPTTTPLDSDAAGDINAAAADSVQPWLFPAGTAVEVVLFAPGEVFPAMRLPPLLPGETSHQVLVREPPRRQIRGTLRRQDGSALPTWRVRVATSRWSGATLDGKLVGEDGFTAGPLPPDVYSVEIMAQGLPTLTLPEVRVQPDADTDLGALVLDALGRVHVSAPTDVPGLTLWVVNEGPGHAMWRLTRQADGSFRSRLLPHGKYRIGGIAYRHRVAEQVVEVRGERNEARIEPAPSPSVAIRVVLPADDLRNQAGWSGKLTVRGRAGDVVLSEVELDQQFEGHYRELLQFGVALPPGTYRFELTGYDRARASQTAEVTAAGGAVELRLTRR